VAALDREDDGSQFSALRAHIELLSTPLRKGEKVAEREDLLLDDDALVNELSALLEAYDRLHSGLAWLKDFAESHEQHHTGFKHMRRYIEASESLRTDAVEGWGDVEGLADDDTPL